MKKITMTLALMVAAMAISCQKDDLSGPNEPGKNADAAYISISVDTNYTRATDGSITEGSTEDGTGDENKISSVAIIAFDKNYDYIGSYQIYKKDDKLECEIAPDARRFFAVVNPTTEILTEINKLSSLSQEEFTTLPAIALTAKSVSTENKKTGLDETRGFTMVSCGSKNSGGILLESLTSIDEELSTNAEFPTIVPIKVDRLVAKFGYNYNKTVFDNNTQTKFGASGTKIAEGEVLGVALTATNKATFIYSSILTDQLTGGNVYRTDHNMAVGQAMTEKDDFINALNANFNWLKNQNEDSKNAFIAPMKPTGSSTEDYVNSTNEYVLENTCLPSYSDSNNLTQAIVKAKYNPKLTDNTLPALGTSWFKMLTTTGSGTLYLSFDDVVDIYNDAYAGFLATPAIKNSMDVQLNNIMGSTGKTWNDSDVTLLALDKCTYGGYKAATVDSPSDYVLQYYQNAENYYDIFISHDKREEGSSTGQPKDHVGRWGMVRNNSYSMTITGIEQEGLPYIPDPTDPEIVDPDNKQPDDPEPADKLNTHIGVSIDINEWVLWTQSDKLE